MGMPAEGAAALDTGAAVMGTGAAVVGAGAVVALGWAAVVTGAAEVVAGAKVVADAWVLVTGPAVLAAGAGLPIGTAVAAAAGAEAGKGPVPGGHSAELVAGSTSASGRPGSDMLRPTAWRRGMCMTWQQQQTGAPQCSDAAWKRDAGFCFLLKVWEQRSALSGRAANGLTWSADYCGAVNEDAALLQALGSDVSIRCLIGHTSLFAPEFTGQGTNRCSGRQRAKPVQLARPGVLAVRIRR